MMMFWQIVILTIEIADFVEILEDDSSTSPGSEGDLDI